MNQQKSQKLRACRYTEVSANLVAYSSYSPPSDMYFWSSRQTGIVWRVSKNKWEASSSRIGSLLSLLEKLSRLLLRRNRLHQSADHAALMGDGGTVFGKDVIAPRIDGFGDIF